MSSEEKEPEKCGCMGPCGQSCEYADWLERQENKTPHNFCETSEEKCTMNYCDENGCQNRKRHLVEENKLPTAKKILSSYHVINIGKRSNIVGYSDAILAMDEYKNIHTKPLLEELEKLKAWKDSAIKNLVDIDLQACGKLLNIGLGQSIADKIVLGIKELKAENERLENLISGYTSSLKDYDVERKHLINENQKLREALESIYDIAKFQSSDYANKIAMKAKEALKGVANG